MQVDVVFCDFVRTETNGKHLLVGVYPGDVVMATHIPGPIQVTAWARVRDLPVGRHQFEMSYYSPQESLVAAATFNGVVEVLYDGMASTLYSGPASIFVEKIGYITVRVKITSSQQQVIGDQIAGKIFVGKVP